MKVQQYIPKDRGLHDIYSRFRIRRRKSILTRANPLKILVRLASTNPDVKIRGAAPTAGTIIFINEELLQVRTEEYPTDRNGRATRVYCDSKGVVVGATAASILPSWVAKVDTAWVSNGAGAFRRIVTCSREAVDARFVAVGPTVHCEDPDPCVVAALTGLGGGLGVNT